MIKLKPIEKTYNIVSLVLKIIFSISIPVIYITKSSLLSAGIKMLIVLLLSL
jgi:hypothetical protein